MKIYAHSQHRTLPYGDVIPWIGESLHPQSGIWLSRAIALEMQIPTVTKRGFKNKNEALLRGKDYNHSSYCDLVISGLVGLEIHDDGTASVDPLIPSDAWEWFCLDGIDYKGYTITVIFDRFGDKYGQKPGLSVLVNNKLVSHGKGLQKLTVSF